MLPTGGGKSAIYELAGLLRAGPTIVVSPLIALQDDQLAHLRAAGLEAHRPQLAPVRARARGRAGRLLRGRHRSSSSRRSSSPTSETLDALRRAGPGLFAVDEAHLISQWGTTSRPDYMRLSAQADLLEVPVRMALTATAAPAGAQTRSSGDSACASPRSWSATSTGRTSSSRRGGCSTVEDKHRELVAAAAEFEGPGIVYAATHAAAEAAHDALAGQRGDALPRRASRRRSGVPR